MKLRHLLIAPTVLLGLLLVLVAGLRFQEQLATVRSAQALSASDLVRASLLRASSALGDERAATYAVLFGAPPAMSIEEARAVTAQRSALALALLHQIDDTNVETELLTRAVDSFTQNLEQIRADADAAMDLPSGEPARLQAAERFFAGVGEIVEDEQALRLSLLHQDVMHSPKLQSEGRMRYYSGLLAEAISQDQALASGMLAPGGAVPDWVARRLVTNIGRGELALDLLRSEAEIADVGASFPRLDRLTNDYLDAIRSGIGGSATPFADRMPEGLGREVIDSAEAALTELAVLQNELLALSREGVDEELNRAHIGLVGSGLVMILAALAVLASYLLTRTRVVRPLEDTIQAMSKLADQDLETPLPEHNQTDEFGAMNQALRVFKANALRRERLAEGQRRLHHRLRESYRALREDLRAAAAIQTTLLPAPGRIADLFYRGLYRPASVVAGDTFNVLQQADGSIGFFQVDVAGHGAPAALGSVVSHHNLSQTIIKRTDGMSLAAIAERIDREWPEDLPYFTMVYGEICLRRSRLQFVQAGHPPPIVIRGDGSLEVLGEGGLPIGLVPGGEYEVTQTRFAEGDRLLVYSDGVSEAADPRGELFGQERLLEAVASNVDADARGLLDGVLEAVRHWREGESLDDDVSLLLLENRCADVGALCAPSNPQGSR